MSAIVKLIVTVNARIEYDADPAYYGTDDPAEMAAIDAQNWKDDPIQLWSTFDDENLVVSVVPA